MSDDSLLALQRAVEEARRLVALRRAERARAVGRLETLNASRTGRLATLARSLRRDPAGVLRWAIVFMRRLAWRRSSSAAVAQGQAALAERRYEDAVGHFDAALRAQPASMSALQGKRAALAKMGELSQLLEVVYRLQAIGDLAPLRRAARLLEGRLRELDPKWLPEIGGIPSPLEPVPGRILHLLKHSLPQHTNGYSIRSHATLIAQTEAGMDPVVVTGLGTSRGKDGSLAPAREEVDGIVHHRLDVAEGFPVDDLPVDEALSLSAALTAPIVAETRPEIIHARSGFRGYDGPLVALALGRHFDIPVVYEASMFLEGTWTDEVDRMERGELFGKRFAQEVRCMREADHVVTIAESMRDEIIARGIDPDRVTVIPNGVDPRRFQPAEPDPVLRDRLGLTGRTVFGYVSNLGNREGVEYLVRAIAELRGRGLQVAGLVVGDGPERANLDALVEELGLQGWVVLTGPVPHHEVAAMYALIDVFVIPRRDERAARLVTPLKPYEAMALGKPLLVADLPALVEVAAPGERGLAFTAEDPIALADAAQRFIQEPGLAKRLGERAREWVLSERTWTSNGPRYREVYDAAARVHAQRRGTRLVVQADRAELERELAQLRAELAEVTREAEEAGRWFRTNRGLLARTLAARVMGKEGSRRRFGEARSVAAKIKRNRRDRTIPPSGRAPRIATHSALAKDGRLPERLLNDASDATSMLELGRRALGLLDTPAPIVLAYLPLVRGNPYQALLYSRCFDEGIATIPVADLDALGDAPALRALGAEVWVHIHWVADVLRDAEGDDDACTRIDAFAAKLDAARAAGVKIAFTVHNLLPHDALLPEAETRLRREIVARCDLVHCLTGSTPEEAEPLFSIPAELVEVVPHPSYQGVYPDVIGQRQARYELGLEAGDLVLGAFGSIQPYKGTTTLLNAFQRAVALDPRLKLIIAGPPSGPSEHLRARCEADPAIISQFGRVAEADLPRYLQACDAVLLTHERVLNSGVLFLAWTFRRPVIAFRHGSLAVQVTPDVGWLIEPSEDALLEALVKVEELRDPSFQLAAGAKADAHSPEIVSRAFAAAVRRRSGQSGAGPR